MTWALYARISTSEDRQNLESQLQPLRRIVPDYETYWEYTDKVSGAKEDREGLNHLIDDCKKGKIDKIVVTELSRLGRSLSHMIRLSEQLQSWNVDLQILKMGVDTSTPTGKLLFSIMSALAEFERELIRERVKRGMERAKSEGKHVGRPSKDIEEHTLIKVDEMRNQGLSWSDIADKTDYSKATIYRKYKSFQKGDEN